LASVSDQSDGRVVVRVSGPHARDMLAKGVMVDLHPRAFRPGDVAVTSVAYIGAHLWQLDDTQTYELAVYRSFGVSFWRWLLEAGAEFGVTATSEM
jgi:heterotetrameric sarcosine oxidase gamma subunit